MGMLYIIILNHNYSSLLTDSQLVTLKVKHFIIWNWPNAHCIYTDGAKLGHKVGCAAFEPTTNTIKYSKLLEITSIFTAELIDIKNGIEIIQKNILKMVRYWQTLLAK